MKCSEWSKEEATLTFEFSWLRGLEAEHLAFCLCEYRYFVGRFTQWLALLIGNSEHEVVRRLLLPNLVEELGGLAEDPSHLDLLDRLLSSCGIHRNDVEATTAATKEHEAWFYEVFANESLLKGLCVIGPGTEEISSAFLLPLRQAVVEGFGSRKLDLRYFDVHLSEEEELHARQLNEAIAFTKASATECEELLATQIETWSCEGKERHMQFWADLRDTIAQRKVGNLEVKGGAST